MQHTTKFTIAKIGAVALSGVVLAGLATPALANDADVIRRGSCAGNSDWKLKASPENNRIEVQGEVDSNVNGQTWKWRMRHNGQVSARGAATTSGPSGSFDVRRLMVDLSGTDRIGWRAKNPATGEVCRGSLRY
ncbi:MAG: hypothetical protein ABI720_04250 [Actinomycetes bacterium]